MCVTPENLSCFSFVLHTEFGTFLLQRAQSFFFLQFYPSLATSFPSSRITSFLTKSWTL